MGIKELVIDAIRKNGGGVGFNQIYEIVRRAHPDVKPQSIRFLLYHETVGINPTFVRIKRGLYRLKAEEETNSSKTLASSQIKEWSIVKIRRESYSRQNLFANL